MTTLSAIAFLLIGATFAYTVLLLMNKNKYVLKQDYEALNSKWQEAAILVRVTDERFASQLEEANRITSKLETKELLITELQNKSTTLDTLIKTHEVKVSELSAELDRNSKLNDTLRENNDEIKLLWTQEKSRNQLLEENSKTLKETIQHLETQLAQVNDQQQKTIIENSTLLANNSALSEKWLTQKEEIAEIQRTAYLQFEKLASQILEEKAGRFTESNKSNIEALLKPLGENIDNFKKRIEETYDKESKERFSLGEKVKDLVEQTNKVSNEANNLASALKGQSKKQGNWGEVILESILQKSGLVRDREYTLQPTIKTEDGNNVRPDVVVKLTDERLIIIDSKVSLVAYDRYFAADTAEEQKQHLNAHIGSIYAHVDNLSSKKYDDLPGALDFTMMFIPIEPAYLIAIQNEAELWSYAYAKRILLISPTNLIACLRLIHDLWRRELQNRNAMDIVKRGELLYEKFTAFATTMTDVGKHIDRSQQSYQTAIAQLNSGTGNLVSQAMKLKSMGLKSSKEIPAALIPMTEEE